MADLELVQIGVVHSRVSDRRLMPLEGVPAEVEVFDAYADGLLLIEENSHVWIIGWFIDADRGRLQIVRPTYEPSRRRRGVFGLRSTARPNSIAASPARLVALRENRLQLEMLDLIDGTPVIDIKRYSPSFDSIFSARSSRDRYLLDRADPSRQGELEAEARHFCGELSPAVVAGVRLVQYVSLNWGIMPKDDELSVTIGIEAIGHVIDAVQALTAATFGSRRLRVRGGSEIRFEHQSRALVFEPLSWEGLDLQALRHAPFNWLFRVVDDPSDPGG